MNRQKTNMTVKRSAILRYALLCGCAQSSCGGVVGIGLMWSTAATAATRRGKLSVWTMVTVLMRRTIGSDGECEAGESTNEE